MKTINKFISGLCFMALLLTSTSCLDDDPLVDWDNLGVVIELPYKTHEYNLTKVTPNENETFPLMVNYTISRASDNTEDISVQLGVDESMVETYNASLAASAQKYKLLPASTYSLPSTLVIKKGTQLLEETMTINTSSLTPGEYYLLPIKITGVPQGYTISGNFGHLYLRVQMAN